MTEWSWQKMKQKYEALLPVSGGSKKKYLGGLAPHHLGGNNG